MLDETSKKGIESGDIMPIHKPTFPAPPVFFEGVETQIVEFRVDPAVIQAHLPAPLKADEKSCQGNKPASTSSG